MFDLDVLLLPVLVGWVECGIATMQKGQFAGVRSGWNSFPCTGWVHEEREQDLSVGPWLPCLPFLIQLCLPIACWGRAGSWDLDQAGVVGSLHGWPSLVLIRAGSGESCVSGSVLSLGGHLTAGHGIKCLWLKVLCAAWGRCYGVFCIWWCWKDHLLPVSRQKSKQKVQLLLLLQFSS